MESFSVPLPLSFAFQIKLEREREREYPLEGQRVKGERGKVSLVDGQGSAHM